MKIKLLWSLLAMLLAGLLVCACAATEDAAVQLSDYPRYAELGKPAEMTYAFAENMECTDVVSKCYTFFITGAWRWESTVVMKELSAKSGVISYTPTDGQYVVLGLSWTDAAGKTHTRWSPEIEIIDGHAPDGCDIRITVPDEVYAGVPAQVKYEIVNAGALYYIGCSVETSAGNIVAELDLPGPTGTIEFTPSQEDIGCDIYIHLVAGDMRKQSNYIPVRSAPDLREPDYAAVYDHDYYIARYPDVAAAFGENRSAALEHFIQCGMSEGRQGCEGFRVDFYRANYADLQAAFGDDLHSYYEHYRMNGHAEGRVADRMLASEEDTNAPDSREAHYAPVYDYDYYIARYPDVAAAFGQNRSAALEHFIQCGMAEGRQGCEGFRVDFYRANYADLQAAFGDDLHSYYEHYRMNGHAEGRVADRILASEEDTNAPDSREAHYAPVYDYDYYIARYPDVAAAFGENRSAALEHFIQCGMSEGRQGCEGFNVQVYRGNYIDLAAAFGDDLKEYYLHYITSGRSEGRAAR